MTGFRYNVKYTDCRSVSGVDLCKGDPAIERLSERAALPPFSDCCFSLLRLKDNLAVSLIVVRDSHTPRVDDLKEHACTVRRTVD